jgi:3-oxoacyl-[acyl-carrier protein] reductase
LLVANGASVTVWDRTPASAPSLSSAAVDVTDSTAIAKALSMLPEPDDPAILVNCAGYLGRTQSFIGHRADDWGESSRQPARHNACHAGGARMRAARGRIINFGLAKEGLASLSAYSAASGGVIAFTKALSRELADKGIFTCVSLGRSTPT